MPEKGLELSSAPSFRKLRILRAHTAHRTHRTHRLYTLGTHTIGIEQGVRSAPDVAAYLYTHGVPRHQLVDDPIDGEACEFQAAGIYLELSSHS